MKQLEADICIIGAGITGLTLAYYLAKGGKKVLLLEKSSRIGGAIQTENENGFIFEKGPNTGVVGNIEIVKLFEELKNKITVELANPTAKNRWILKGGKWRALPSGLISAVFTPLFTLKDKFRILAEPFRKKGNNPHESVANLVRRRLGKSYLNYAVDPFISGIYSGDPEKLITQYALPKLYELEQNYGSFIRGAIKKAKKQKTELEQKVSREVFSIQGGLEKLTTVLGSVIGTENILLNCMDVRVEKKGSSFLTNLKNLKGETIQLSSPKLISTVGGTDIESIFPFIKKENMEKISNTRYAKVVQVVACYNKWEGKSLKAFGGLIPSKEKRQSLGILFPSSLFHGRAPQKGAILSVFLGGIRKASMIEKSDTEIQQIALREIVETLQQKTPPDVLHIYRYPQAIPQYEKTTGERLRAIGKLEKEYPGLILAGNIRDGIGMADRIKQASLIAKNLVHAL